jgi:hypothetical protein
MSEFTQGLRPEYVQGPGEGEDSDQCRGQRSPESAQTGTTESFRSGHGLDVVQNREGRTLKLM